MPALNTKVSRVLKSHDQVKDGSWVWIIRNGHPLDEIEFVATTSPLHDELDNLHKIFSILSNTEISSGF